ncbi:hypothetical protein [Streptomyces sp. YGL11-2]|uniref:hypothetical protein n=1 Tax=Streptomyces sp. YGL11-2 TaxID=3414028 RepID=UPI003CEDA400
MEGFEKFTGVTLAGPILAGQLRPIGEVCGHATDPITDRELVMVLWLGTPKPLPYEPDELAHLD